MWKIKGNPVRHVKPQTRLHWTQSLNLLYYSDCTCFFNIKAIEIQMLSESDTSCMNDFQYREIL